MREKEAIVIIHLVRSLGEKEPPVDLEKGTQVDLSRIVPAVSVLRVSFCVVSVPNSARELCEDCFRECRALTSVQKHKKGKA